MENKRKVRKNLAKRINVGPYIHMFYVVNSHVNNLYVLSNKAVGRGKKFEINKLRAYVYSRG